MEIYAIDTVTLTGEQFLTGDRNGKPTRIGGELRLPSAGTAKAPAVTVGARVGWRAHKYRPVGDMQIWDLGSTMITDILVG